MCARMLSTSFPRLHREKGEVANSTFHRRCWHVSSHHRIDHPRTYCPSLQLYISTHLVYFHIYHINVDFSMIAVLHAAQNIAFGLPTAESLPYLTLVRLFPPCYVGDHHPNIYQHNKLQIFKTRNAWQSLTYSPLSYWSPPYLAAPPHIERTCHPSEIFDTDCTNSYKSHQIFTRCTEMTADIYAESKTVLYI